MFRRFPLLASAAASLCFVLVNAFAQTPTTPSATCPPPEKLNARDMLGLWRAEFQGQWSGATLLFEPHPTYAGSFRGTINRDGERAQLAGDMEEGELTLEESNDGQRISATWLGDVVDGSCGKEIRGTWQATGAPEGRGFVLRKQP
jgi:hypothetical protein